MKTVLTILFALSFGMGCALTPSMTKEEMVEAEKQRFENEKRSAWQSYKAGAITKSQYGNRYIELRSIHLTKLLDLGDEETEREDFEYWKAKAKGGDARHQIMMGVRLRDGKGVEQDFKEAFEWFQKAADQNHVLAQGLIGDMYAAGKGVPQNYKEAVKWYRKAAEQGNKSNQGLLGMYYFAGKGVPEDRVTGYAWLNISAANGDAQAEKEKRDLAYLLTPEQIARAQELSTEMVKKNPRLLGK